MFVEADRIGPERLAIEADEFLFQLEDGVSGQIAERSSLCSRGCGSIAQAVQPFLGFTAVARNQKMDVRHKKF